VERVRFDNAIHRGTNVPPPTGVIANGGDFVIIILMLALIADLAFGFSAHVIENVSFINTLFQYYIAAFVVGVIIELIAN
jgi:hypothetical protein